MMSEQDNPTTATEASPLASAPFPVIGIGASAGGIVAVRLFLGQMPARSGMAFVVILHLSPKHESSADAVLQQVTRMPVHQVSSTTLIEPDHVYVISPRHDLQIVDGYLSKSITGTRRTSRRPSLAVRSRGTPLRSQS